MRRLKLKSKDGGARHPPPLCAVIFAFCGMGYRAVFSCRAGIMKLKEFWGLFDGFAGGVSLKVPLLEGWGEGTELKAKVCFWVFAALY